MKITHLMLAITMLQLFGCISQAAFTDFEDLAIGSVYRPGDSLITGSLGFTLRNVGTANGVAIVYDSDTFGGPGNSLLINTVGLELTMPDRASELSTLFGVGSVNASLSINGEEMRFLGDEPIPDSTILGGVQVTIRPTADLPNYRGGELILQGDIRSVVFRGDELVIDTVAVTVPEPSATTLYFSAFVVVMYAGRHRLKLQSHMSIAVASAPERSI